MAGRGTVGVGTAARRGVVAALRAEADAAGAVHRGLDVAALVPMLAETNARVFSEPGWFFEPKYDGVRVLAVRRGTDIRLVYRSGQDATRRFPEIARSLAQLACDDFVLDGEIVALNVHGAISFEELQKRLGRDGAAASHAQRAVPVVMFCFDVLRVAGYDVRDLPLSKRKDLLRRLVPDTAWLRCVDYIEEHGEALFEAITKQGGEGIVAKRATSTYQCGRRSRDWLKIKAFRTADVVIVGYMRGQGSRQQLGSLMVAWQQAGELVYAGNVGTGLSTRIIEQLLPRLASRTTAAPAFQGKPPGSPRAQVFVVPELIVEVRYTEVTTAGYLRHPVFLRLRDDKAIGQCDAPRAGGGVVRGG